MYNVVCNFIRKTKKKNKKLQFCYQLLTLTRNSIALYKSCVYCKHKTSLVRCSDYFREQYYAFKKTRSFSIKGSVQTKNLCEYVCAISV